MVYFYKQFAVSHDPSDALVLSFSTLTLSPSHYAVSTSQFGGRLRLDLNKIFGEIRSILDLPSSAPGLKALSKYADLMMSGTCVFDQTQGISLLEMWSTCRQILPPGRGIRLEILPIQSVVDSMASLPGHRVSLPAFGTVYFPESQASASDQVVSGPSLKHNGPITVHSPKSVPEGGFAVTLDSPISRRKSAGAALMLSPQVCWMSGEGVFQKCEFLGSGAFSKVFAGKVLVSGPEFNADDRVAIRKHHSKLGRGQVRPESLVSPFTVALKARLGELDPETTTLLNLSLVGEMSTLGHKVRDQNVSIHKRATCMSENYIKSLPSSEEKQRGLDQLAQDGLAALSLIHDTKGAGGEQFIHGDINPNNIGWFAGDRDTPGRFGVLDMASLQLESANSGAGTLAYIRVDGGDDCFLSRKNDRFALALSYCEIGINQDIPTTSPQISVKELRVFFEFLEKDVQTLADLKSTIRDMDSDGLSKNHQLCLKFMKQFVGSPHIQTQQLLGYLFPQLT